LWMLRMRSPNHLLMAVQWGRNWLSGNVLIFLVFDEITVIIWFMFIDTLARGCVYGKSFLDKTLKLVKKSFDFFLFLIWSWICVFSESLKYGTTRSTAPRRKEGASITTFTILDFRTKGVYAE
jgi:hypothetical protein